MGLLLATSLSLSPWAAESSLITVGLQYSQPLLPGDIISLSLPDFSGASLGPADGGLALGGADDTDFDAAASEWDEATKTLRLVVGAEVDAGTTLEVAAQQSNGITLPSA